MSSIDPLNKDVLSIYSDKGRYIIKNYFKLFQNGGNLPKFYYKKKKDFLLVKVVFNKVPKFRCDLKFTKNYIVQPYASFKHREYFKNIKEQESGKGWNELYELCKNKTFAYCLRINKKKNKCNLFLCQTGNEKKKQDLRCKHSFLGKYSGLFKKNTGICGAGFCVFKDNHLFFDNMSGTYKPSVYNLENVKKFLKNNLNTNKISIIKMSKKNKNRWCDIFLDSPDRKNMNCNYNLKNVKACLKNTKTKSDFIDCINRK